MSSIFKRGGKTMGKYLQKRIVKGIITFFITITLTFLIVRLMPADPTTMLMDNRLTAAQQEQMLEDFGLDKPLPLQYVSFLGNLFKGDLGLSFMQKRPVMDIIKERLPWTLLLMIVTQAITLLIGIPLGVYSGYRR